MADEHEHVGLGRIEHELQRVDPLPEVCAAWNDVPQPTTATRPSGSRWSGRNLRQPLGLHGDRLPRQVSCHGALYTMAGVGVFERFELQNGLRVLTAPMPHAQSVTCMVMLAAGSRYETPDTNGIAHFSEHMFFKGTERRPTARDIAGEIDAIGGEFNAFTGKEYTGYYVKCAAEHRDIALDVLVDMLRNSRFDAEEIDREKGVIVEEMNMYFDTPRDLHRRRLRGAPLRRPAARLGHHRPQGDRPRRDARDVHRLPRQVVPARSAWCSASAARSATACSSARRSCSATCRSARRASPSRCRPYENGRGEGLHEAVRPGAPRPRRAELSDRASRPLRAPGARDRARRRHVVAPLHRGARAPRPRVLRLRA